MALNTEKNILVVDDDKEGLTSLAKILKKEGYGVDESDNAQDALEKIRNSNYNAVITDLKMAEMDGMQLLKAIKITQPDIQVIMITAFGTIEKAVEAMKVGAFDFIEKPLKRPQLLKVLNMALENQALIVENKALKEMLDSFKTGQVVIGNSEKMRETMQLVYQVAPTDSTVLLLGESGTGKEIIAHAVHNASARKNKPFHKISCAALPETLLEAELFGYEKGAFTGAHTKKAGRFETAHQGTILLDEIGEIPNSIQVKLLRMLQEGEVQKLGANTPQKFDVRVIAATNMDLENAVKNKTFREDLYYRLNVVKIEIPPLRERREDIPLLAMSFIKFYSSRNQKNISSITSAALDLITGYDWPGNVRELENSIERAVVLTKDHVIKPSDLPKDLQDSSKRSIDSITVPIGTPLKDVADILIEETLKKTGGDKNLAAKMLGVAARTIYRKVKN